MIFLHPLFTAVFVFMILYSFVEINGDMNSGVKKNPVVMIVLTVVLILLSGLRMNVGADYPVYRDMYQLYFPVYVKYKDILPKMFFGKSNVEIEWIYAMMNKLLLDFTGAPFYIFTLIVSIITLSIKSSFFYKNSVAPVFSFLIFFIPGYFISDSGHMRQALGMAMAVYSFKFIKERKVWLFLLCIYVAIGFHKSTIVFLPAYWFATWNLNTTKMIIMVLICIALSPLKLYENMSFLVDTISIEEIKAGYEGYIQVEGGEGGAVKFMDILSMFYLSVILFYDKEACEEIPYYEYMRNIGFLGICIYFIMRNHPVFSTRLVGVYNLYLPIVIGNAIFSIKNASAKKMLHLSYIAFFIFYYFTFAKYHARGASFTPETYQNYLWSE